ncbi:MAG: aminotransferase class I/II-fold pyridoxal phosphate-dependent enzyme, partial [Erysipelotrichaceae bacterium]|nr:aminotransferase class I/II-fold pyridoxal phosphate-dependent enzyme [Erysipelotrichaceae bacterium]
MIKFNEMPSVGIEEELSYLRKALENGKIGNNGEFTKLDQEILKEKLNAKEVLLTTNGSSALVLAAMLLGIGYGDEVIMPSFTFSTTAASVVDLGAVPVFVDIRPDTMNIDEEKIEAAITGRTKAITVVHYAGVGCNMERVMEIARKHNLYVIEDAAQVVNARYHGKYLGTFGDIGCFSF